MKKIVKDEIYCVFCKEINQLSDKVCKKCHKKLDPKENMLLDYLKDHIKSDLVGKTEDKVISIIKNYIISHLYGAVFSVTLLFTIASALVLNADKYEVVTKKPDFLINEVVCDIQGAREPLKLCEEGYTLDDDVCVKREILAPVVTSTCRSGFTKYENECFSDMDYQKLSKQECIMPNNENYLRAYEQDGVCLVDVCSEWAEDGTCSAGSAQEIDYTTTYYCNEGYTLVEGICKMVEKPINKYSCNEGVLENNQCKLEEIKTYTLGCLDNYILNEECNVCVEE